MRQQLSLQFQQTGMTSVPCFKCYSFFFEQKTKRNDSVSSSCRYKRPGQKNEQASRQSFCYNALQAHTTLTLRVYTVTAAIT